MRQLDEECLLLMLQRDRRDPVLGDPLELGEHRGETALEAVRPGDQLEADEIERPRHRAALEIGDDERPRRQLAHAEEAVLQRLEQELLDELALDDRARLRGRIGNGPEHLHGGIHPAAIDVHDRLVGEGERGRGARARVVDRRDGAEARDDLLLHRGGIDVADDDDRHEIGAVPVFIEAADRRGERRVEPLGLPDRQPLEVASALAEEHLAVVRLDLLREGVGEARAPLPLHHPALGDDFGGVQLDRARGPVLEHRQALVQERGLVGRNGEHVHGLVEARVRVEVGPEAHPGGFHEVDQRLMREVRRAVEGHVLEEVRHSALVVVLLHRTGVHDQSQLGAPLRARVVAHVVAQPVRERAHAKGGIVHGVRAAGARRGRCRPAESAGRGRRERERHGEYPHQVHRSATCRSSRIWTNFS
jgi:hypothetical protein